MADDVTSKSAEKEEVVTTSSATPISTVSDAKTAPDSGSAEKKSGPNKLVIACVVILLVVCCALCAVGVILPRIAGDALKTAVTNSNTGKDESLVRLKQSDLVQTGKDWDARVAAEKNKSRTGKTSVEISEKEYLYLMSKSSSLGKSIEDIGIDIEAGYMKIQFGMESLLKSSSSTKLDSTSTELFKGMYPTITIEPSILGTSLRLKSFTTGNSLVDSAIKSSSLNSQLEQSFNQSVNKGLVNGRIDKISFEKDKMVISYYPSTVN